MIIKPIENQTDSLDDISNIKHARRFIFIYKYNSPRGALLNEFDHPSEMVYGKDLYGIYLINISTIDGVNYIVPKNFTVHSRNGYRGSCWRPLNPDGSIDKNATVNFYITSYSNRVHNKQHDNVLDGVFSTMQTLTTEFQSEQELLNLLHSDIASPFPQYYNIEDQARLADENYKSCDFTLNYSEVTSYKLGDLIDSRTSVMIVGVDGENNNVILDSCSDFISVNGSNIDFGQLKDKLLQVFTECFMSTMESVFSDVYYVFDFSTGMFNVPTNQLKLKYKYGLTKKDVGLSYASLVDRASYSADMLIEDYSTSCDDTPCIALPQYRMNSKSGAIFDLVPDKLHIYTSMGICSLKLEFNSLYGFNKKETFHMNICSTGDTDEIAQFSLQQ